MTDKTIAEAIAAQGRVNKCLRYLQYMVDELDAIRNKGYELPEGITDHMMAISEELGMLRTAVWESYMTAKE